MHELADLGAFHLGRPPSFMCSLHGSPGKGRIFGACGEFRGHIWKWYTQATGPDPVVWLKPNFEHSWEMRSFCVLGKRNRIAVVLNAKSQINTIRINWDIVRRKNL